MEKTIDIIVGSNYGDCGKGRITAYLANQYDVDKTLVVRSSSGFQCSHTVISGDKRHVFHGFGSGTLDGYPTYLSNGVVVNPIIFRQEMEELKAMGVNPKIYINRRCYITLPTHMLANQCIEKLNIFFEDRYGTCGIGVWETMNDHVLNSTYINVNKLRNEKFYNKVRKHYGSKRWFENRIHQNYDDDMIHDFAEAEETYRHYLALNLNDDMWAHFYQDLGYMYDNCTVVEGISDIPDIEHYVFEMSQGILLSATRCHRSGIAHDCTSGATTGIINELTSNLYDKFDINLNYVTRWYMTRHGNVLRHDTRRRREELSPLIVDNTNVPNEWQGEMVFGLLDVDALANRIDDDFRGFCRYFENNFSNVNILPKSIYVTCIDQINEGYLPHMSGCTLSRESSLSQFLRNIIKEESFANIYLCLSESNDDIVPFYRWSNTLPALKTYMYNGKNDTETRLRREALRTFRNMRVTATNRTESAGNAEILGTIDLNDNRYHMVTVDADGSISISTDVNTVTPF